MPAFRTQPRRRGIAMILVLIVIAAASILTYATISTASLQSQLSNAASQRIQRQYLAESGLNLALYYIQNPKSSPVDLVYGQSGNVHYPGETNITLGDMPGTVTIAVTNPSNGVFQVVSTGTIDGSSVTARSTIAVTKERVFDKAAYLSGNVSFGSKVTVAGGLTTDGTLTAPTNKITGAVVAANGPTYGGTTAPSNLETSFPISMLYYLPTYYYNGKKYTAKKLSTSVVGGTLLDANIIGNPCNVWYCDQNVTFLLGTIVNGSVVTTNGKSITTYGSLTITPVSGMPGLVVDKNLIFASDAKTVRVDGPAYIGNAIKGSGTTTSCNFIVSGTVLSGTSGWIGAGTYNGSMSITNVASKAKSTGFADELENIKTLTIQSWDIDNGRPQ